MGTIFRIHGYLVSLRDEVYLNLQRVTQVFTEAGWMASKNL